MDDSPSIDVRRSAFRLYAQGQEIWQRGDLWNAHKRSCIERFVAQSALELIDAAGSILNAGSGGESYNWLPKTAVNSDLFLEQVKKLPQAIVSDVTSLPFSDGSFDLSICVGSVLNYVSIGEAIGELARTVKPGGHLIIHYESSNSFERWFTRSWNKAVAGITTINSFRVDKIWVYSNRYVAEVLAEYDLIPLKAQSFHIASALASRIGLSQNAAARFAVLDPWVKILGTAADDQIILVKKPN